MKDEEIFIAIDSNTKIIKMANGSAHLNLVDSVFAVKDLIKQSQLDLLGRLKEQGQWYITAMHYAVPVEAIARERERIKEGE